MKKLNWIRLFRSLKLRDRLLVAFLVVSAFVALVFWLGALYLASTYPIPAAGGEYTEGIAAQPRYINPLLAQTSEADADLTQLIYSGLFGYDAAGNLIKRLASDYNISEDGKVITVRLREGVKWHDGKTLTAEDVLYTVRTIQDPVYKSPLRPNWLAVEVASPDPATVTFTLKKPYFGFLENLTVGILPKHIWENISPDNFLLADYNLAPIGSGPYRFFNSEKDSSGNMLSYELRAFGEYFEGPPLISKFTFQFYPDEVSLVAAYNRKEVLGISAVTPAGLSALEERKSTRVYDIAIPRIFAVFFNVTKNAALAYSEVREALAYATDREAIIRDVLAGKGQPAYTAFLPFMKGYAADLGVPSFDLERAKRILDENGWQPGADGIRAKDGTVLALELMSPDWPELTQTAELLRTQWERLGVRVKVTQAGAADLQRDVIRPRAYEALLFGEAALLDSDPYSFWHSSQKNDPGLNLALFENKEADELLTSLREEMNADKRSEKYRRFQEILSKENPAVFLYTPTYLYVVNDVIKGIDVKQINAAALRLSNVKDWYIKTRRVWK